MPRNKVITPGAAARVVLDGDTVAVGGFVGVGVPEEIAIAIETRFLETGSPRDITLVFSAGPGDGATRGLNHFARAGLVRRAIGGHWGLAPVLGRLAMEDSIEAYCFPQGVISHLFRDIAAHKPGTITRVGLGTFVDPRIDGGRINSRAREDLVRLLEIDDEEYLYFPPPSRSASASSAAPRRMRKATSPWSTRRSPSRCWPSPRRCATPAALSSPRSSGSPPHGSWRRRR